MRRALWFEPLRSTLRRCGSRNRSSCCSVCSPRAQLGETIRAARKSCEQHGRQLVLFADVGVAKDILLELREHEAGGVPLVEAFEGRERIETVRKLAEVCLPFLKK